MTDGDASGMMAVPDSCVNVQRQMYCFFEIGNRRPFAVLKVNGGTGSGRAAAGFDNVVCVAAFETSAFKVPVLKVGNGSPGGHARPYIGCSTSHQQSGIAAAGNTYQIYAIGIHLGVSSGIIHRTDNIGDDQFGAGGLRLSIRPSKIRVYKDPALVDAPLSVRDRHPLQIISRPGV